MKSEVIRDTMEMKSEMMCNESEMICDDEEMSDYHEPKISIGSPKMRISSADRGSDREETKSALIIDPDLFSRRSESPRRSDPPTGKPTLEQVLLA